MAETLRIEIPIEAIDNTDPELANVKRNFENMEKAADSANSAVKKAGQSTTAFDKQAQKTEKSLSSWAKQKYQVMLEAKEKITPILQSIGGGLRSFAGKTWSVTMRAFDFITSPVRGIINLLKNPIFQVGAVLGVSIGLKDTIETYKDFEAAMSQVQAISGATSNELVKLTAKAKEMGATTKFTAEESAQAFNYMAMAGWKTSDMLEGIEGILSLAAAGGEDLATTSDIVTDAITAFNMKASDAGRFSDVMAAAASNANTNISMMGETFKYAGAMAGTLGYSIEDVALMTGLMANSGIKATMSGTALNMIFTRLSTNTGNARDALTDLGIQFFNSSGNARDLSDVMGELRKATSKMNDEQKSSIANTIAGTQAQKGLLAILNASESDYNKLAEAINNADGAAAQMSETMLDNLQGSITLLQSAVDGVKISFGERLSPYVRSLADWLIEQMPAVEQGLSEFMDWLDSKIDNAKRKLSEITNTDDWQDAGFFGKAHILWDEFIAEPFSEWWREKGKIKFAAFSANIGNAIGTGLKAGILTILGIDVSESVDAGASIGASFARGFSEGFDFNSIQEKLWKGIGNLAKDAGKLLPGGESAGLSSVFSAILLGKIASPFIGMGRGILGIGKGMLGMNLLGSAASGTGLLGKSALFAINAGAGNLANGASMGAGALSALGMAGGVGGIAAGATLISGAFDAYKAIKSDNLEEKNIYGESAAWKASGTAAGAAAGAALGSVIPGIGTAIGALIGAGAGGIAGWIKGNKVKEEYEENLEKMRQEAEKAQKVFQATGLDIDNVRFKNEVLTEAMNDSETSMEEFAAMFQEECANVMTEAFGDIHLSLTDVKKLASEITFDNMKKSFDEFTEAASNADTALENLQQSVTKLKKENWKVALGMELSEKDMDNYRSTIDSFVDSVQTYIKDNHYEATVALDLLTEGKGSTKGLDTMYGGFETQAAKLGTKLSEAIEKAMKDGIIDIDEMAVIEEYQKKISNITNKIAEAKNEAQLQAIGIKYSGSELDIESYQAMQEELKAYSESAQANFDDALTVTLTNLKLELAEGAITEKQYNDAVAEATKGYQAQLNDVSARINSFNLEAITSAYEDELNGILPYFEGTLQEKLQQAINNAMISHPDTATWKAADVIEWLGLDSMPTEVATPFAEQLIQAAQANTDATKKQLIENYKKCIPTAEEIYAAIDWESFTFNDQDALMKLIDPTYGQGAGFSVSDKTKSIADYYADDWKSVAKSISEVISTTMQENLDPLALQKVIDEYFSQVTTTNQPNMEQFNSLVRQFAPGPISNEYYNRLLEEYSKTGTQSGSKFNEGLSGALLNGSLLYRTSAETAINSAFANPFSVTAKINITPSYNSVALPLLPSIIAAAGNYATAGNHATGGYVSGGPQLSWLAEEGWGEFVIPTNPSRRSDAIELYQQAGQALGVSQHAEGGYVSGSYLSDYAAHNNFPIDPLKNESSSRNEPTEDNMTTTPSSPRNESHGTIRTPIQVHVNMTPEFNITGGEAQTEEDVMQVIRRHMREMADELGGEIADKLSEVFSNMPLKEA